MHQALTYPAAPPRPESNTIGGITYDDPFQWLEAGTPESVSWQTAQDELAQGWLRSAPAWQSCAKTVQRLHTDAFWHWAPLRRGGRWFRQFVPEGSRLAALEVSESPTGPGRVLFDLNTVVAPDGMATFRLWEPSPDGRSVVCCAADPSGTAVVRVIETESGRVVLDGLPHTGIQSVAWLPDGSGFYYTCEHRTPAGQSGRVYLKRLDADRAPEPQHLPGNPPVWRVEVSADGRHAVLLGLDLRPHCLRDLTADGPWTPFLGDGPGPLRGVVLGDAYVAISKGGGAPDGRVVAIPLATAQDRATWRELIPGGTSILVSLNSVGERLVLGDWFQGAARLRILDCDGAVEGEIPLPGPGLVWTGPDRVGGMVVPGNEECTFVFSSLTRSPASYRYDLRAHKLEPLTEPRVVLDGATVRHHTARGRDGTPIPYLILARDDVSLDTACPTLISAYGGMNNFWPPAYLFALHAAWVDHGGVYVHAHLRGGGEFGARWWQAARRHSKQTTFDDLYAVAEDLIARGRTTPDQLGVFGTSVGSLPAAVAVTQRPTLFRAAAAMMPLLDLLRCGHDPATMSAIVGPELGDPDDPADARVLYGYSPYHNVTDGTPYPAVLFDCGAMNRLCPAWHGRKAAARLQRATSSGHPVLLRVRPTGHNSAMTPAQTVEREAETMTFLATELGLGT